MKLLYVLILCYLYATLSQAAFYDCETHLTELKSDLDALDKVKQAFADKYKFASACLEILLRKNFFQAGEFLLNEYYPKTSIDTEIIVRNVANEIKRNQDYLIFQLKKREKNNVFPHIKPVIYWAQSTDDILIMIKLHHAMDTPECK